MMDYELAIKYKPYIMFDRMEPFQITGVGYTIFRKSKQSKSFPNRFIEVNTDLAAFVIEYAIWYDYDIEHLYELEHIWIMVGFDGSVIDAEGSFHGKYIREVNPKSGEPVIIDRTHLMVYAQPGKHVFMPEPDLFRLVPRWNAACNTNAGQDGLIIPDMFQGQFSTNEALQKKTEHFIRSNFSFQPSMEFEFRPCNDDLFMEWDNLYASIPDRVHAQIRLITRQSEREEMIDNQKRTEQ